MSSIPDNEQVRDIARNIFARDEFNPQNHWLNDKWQDFWNSIIESWEQTLRNWLESWSGVSPDPELIKTLVHIGLAAGVLIIAVILYIIGRQFYKRVNRFRPFPSDSKSPANKLSFLQQAYAAAAQGDYALACTCLFKAVLLKIWQEGYNLPFDHRSTRWIISELERLRYPSLSALQNFCTEFNYIRYYVGNPDESEWIGFLQRSEKFLLKPRETP